jgi:hypothetical protein
MRIKPVKIKNNYKSLDFKEKMKKLSEKVFGKKHDKPEVQGNSLEKHESHNP